MGNLKYAGKSVTIDSADATRLYSRRLIAVLAARRSTLAGILSTSLVLNLLGLAMPRLTQTVLDRVVPGADMTLLSQLMLALVLVTTFQLLFAVVRRVTLVRLSLDLDRIVLTEVYDHLIALPTHFFRQRRAGDLVARLQDHGHVRHLCVGASTRVAIDLLMVSVYVVVLFCYSVRLAAVVLGVLSIFAVFTLLMGPVLKRQHRRQAEDKATQDAHLIEMIAGIDLVKAMALEEPIRTRWTEAFERYLTGNFRMQKLRQILESAGTGLQFLGMLAVLWYGAILVMDGHLSLGQLVAFSMYASQVLQPLVSLITLWDEVQQARVAVERMQEVLDHEPEVIPATMTSECPVRLVGRIQFAGVRFRYGGPDSPEVLRGITFTIEPGERVALVGRSGAGKSTIARLMAGLYRPALGQILIDDRDLATLDLVAFRRQIAVVLQENLLLSGTVRENIVLGNPQPREDKIAEAARLAGAHEFITAMPRGYETVVGEQGLTLSAGQRQRINLARAIYREPRLIILDEATSALDHVSDAEVSANLHDILAGRTALIIAHKMTTVRLADRILVLRDGVIAEEGSHTELIARRGLYYELSAGQLDE